jgi:hypothetical protein
MTSRGVLRGTAVALGVMLSATAAGCTTTHAGAPRAARESTPSTRPAVRSATPPPRASATPPSAAPRPPLTVAQLRPLLLKRSELAAIMGDTDMTQMQAFTEPHYNDVTIAPAGCRAVAAPAETAVWTPDTAALVGDANRGANGRAATQVVALMTSADVAAEAVTGIARSWQGQCPTGQPFTMTLEEGPVTWTPAPVRTAGPPPRISVSFTRTDPDRFCTHAYTADNNVLIEALACGPADTAAQADSILDRIAAQVP